MGPKSEPNTSSNGLKVWILVDRCETKIPWAWELKAQAPIAGQEGCSGLLAGAKRKCLGLKPKRIQASTVYAGEQIQTWSFLSHKLPPPTSRMRLHQPQPWWRLAPTNSIHQLDGLIRKNRWKNCVLDLQTLISLRVQNQRGRDWIESTWWTAICEENEEEITGLIRTCTYYSDSDPVLPSSSSTSRFCFLLILLLYVREVMNRGNMRERKWIGNNHVWWILRWNHELLMQVARWI